MVCTAAESEMGLVASYQRIERVRIESGCIESGCIRHLLSQRLVAWLRDAVVYGVGTVAVRRRMRTAAAREACGVQPDHDRGSGRERQPVDDDIAGGDSRSDADGSDVTKRLFDELGYLRRIRSQRRVLLGPVGQHCERRSQLVAGGIGARQQEGLDHSDQLVGAEPVAVFGDRNEL